MPYGDAWLYATEWSVHNGYTTQPLTVVDEHVDLGNKEMEIDHSHNPEDPGMFFRRATYSIEAEGDWEDYPNE